MLRRRQPLKRTPFRKRQQALADDTRRAQVKRTRNPRPKRRRKPSKSLSYYLQVKPDRDAWKADQPSRCWWCDVAEWESAGPLQVHEIERKSQAPGRWGKRCNYCLLCAECHESPFGSMPHARQLALKYLHDPLHFSLEEWLSIKPRPESYVTMDEVLSEAERLQENETMKKKPSMKLRRTKRQHPILKLVRLCEELDMEMDGVTVPATAAAILNGIRATLDELEGELSE